MSSEHTATAPDDLVARVLDEGFLAVAGAAHLVSFGAQVPGEEIAQGAVVLDDQDGGTHSGFPVSSVWLSRSVQYSPVAA